MSNKFRRTLFVGDPLNGKVHLIPKNAPYWRAHIEINTDWMLDFDPEDLSRMPCEEEYSVVEYNLKTYISPYGLEVDVMVCEESEALEVEYTFSRHKANLLGQDCCMAILQTGALSHFRRN